MKLSKDEQWVIDLFPVANGSALSPKVILGLWENSFPKRELMDLRQAIKSLQEKQLVEVSSDGSLSLAQQSDSAARVN